MTNLDPLSSQGWTSKSTHETQNRLMALELSYTNLAVADFLQIICCQKMSQSETCFSLFILFLHPKVSNCRHVCLCLYFPQKKLMESLETTQSLIIYTQKKWNVSCIQTKLLVLSLPKSPSCRASFEAVCNSSVCTSVCNFVSKTGDKKMSKPATGWWSC